MNELTKDSPVYQHLKKLYIIYGTALIPRGVIYENSPDGIIRLAYEKYYYDWDDKNNDYYIGDMYFLTQEFVELMKLED